tara:strand:- start:567 stop:758 length:192 start_codon:yes stop_codon:yes gene_type:complete
MNDTPPKLRTQCDNLLAWMQDRSDELVLNKQYEDMFALYMEWHEWIEEDNPSLMVIGEWDEEE